MANKDALLSIIEMNIDQQQFRSLHWEGSFDDYLQLVANNPAVARNAFQGARCFRVATCR